MGHLAASTLFPRRIMIGRQSVAPRARWEPPPPGESPACARKPFRHPFFADLICVVTAALLLSLVFPTTNAGARDSLRCRGRLVQIGDTPDEVRTLCGPPDDIASEERYPDAWISKYDYDPYGRPRLPYLIEGPIHYEWWTYDFGSNRLPYDLLFENAKLIRIESGRRQP
jgi:hypothetical protein